MFKESVDLKSKVDVLEKKLNKSSEVYQKLSQKVFEPFNKHDKMKDIEKIKTSNNSLKKVVDESKELLKTIEKNDEDKKYLSADELLKGLNARTEDNREINKKLKEYHAKEAQRASQEVEKFNKIINDNLDMSSEKSEIINRLKELYRLRQLYYLNRIDDNLEINKKIDNILISREINELEKRLRDQHKKGSGIFTSQKAFAKLLTFLAQLHA